MGIIIEPTDYDDWRWGGSGVNPPGAPSAAVLTEVDTTQWNWLFTNNSVLVFPDQQLPHDYAEGTDLIPHMHWAPTTTGTYTGTWTLTITDWLSNAPGSPRQAQTILTYAFNGSITAHQCQTSNFSAVLTGVGRKISSCLTAHLILSLSAGAGCYLLGIDAHYRKDRLGSSGATTK